MAATKKPRASTVRKVKVASTKKSRRTTRTTAPSSPYTNLESSGIIVFAALALIFFLIAIIRYM